jgi:hypothetical protein
MAHDYKCSQIYYRVVVVKISVSFLPIVVANVPYKHLEALGCWNYSSKLSFLHLQISRDCLFLIIVNCQSRGEADSKRRLEVSAVSFVVKRLLV